MQNSIAITVTIPHRKTPFPSLLLLFPLFFLPLAFSDPRISESFLFCGADNKTQSKNYVPTFVKEMENLSQLINSTHFATYHLNTTSSAVALGAPPIYAMAHCQHDLSQTDCLLCFATSRTKLPRCLPSVSAAIFLDGCFLRYDNHKFYSEFDSPNLEKIKCSEDKKILSNYEIESEFLEKVESTVGNLTRMGGIKGYGIVEMDGVYGLAECWKSVDRTGCRECLEKVGKGIISRCGTKIKREGRGMNAGCYLRLMSPIEDYPKLGKNHGQVSTSMKRSYMNFKYETLEKATDYFNPSKKLGQGGAGSVFKGTLPNGVIVAVKRLVFNTRQWIDDFFNEVNLISRIQHKNLVKLLGCSIEGPDSLLVYEYVPNKSLDRFIFDNKNTSKVVLSWKQRFNIIVGIAEGLTYLHEGSEIRIIHRDIKSSNILLDQDFSPKIADFGLVRCFATDKSHLSTGVAGTLGYMAPEYLIRGQLTEKADVFSFGILVMEIISGRRNNVLWENSTPLLQTVWNLYKSNKLIAAVDCNLREDYPAEEARKVLQIALLCTQAPVALRPSMAQVVLMLIDKTSRIPIPNQPPFLNSSVLEASNSTRSYGTSSWISNAVTNMAVSSHTSSEGSSSLKSSDVNSGSRELTHKY